MKKLFLFDIDNTLVRNSTVHRTSFLESVRRNYHIEPDFEGIDLFGQTDSSILLSLLKKYNIEESFKSSSFIRCQRSMENIYKHNAASDTVKAISGVKELLDALEDKVNLGIVSGNFEKIAWLKLKKTGMQKYFNGGGFGSDSTDRSECVKIAVERAGNHYDISHKNNVIVFGDTPKDIIAAHKAGCVAVGIATGHFSFNELAEYKPEYLFDNYNERNKILSIC